MSDIEEFQDGFFWVAIEGNLARIGCTNRLFEEMGSLESIDFPSEGDFIELGAVLMQLHGDRKSVELVTPRSGRVLNTHSEILEKLDMIEEDPLEEGWLVQIEISENEGVSKDGVKNQENRPA